MRTRGSSAITGKVIALAVCLFMATGFACAWAMTAQAADTPVEEGAVSVIFDANGGKGKMDVQKVKVDVETVLAANKFTNDNDKLAFAGWNTKKDGKGLSYDDKARVKLAKDTTLYAQWKDKATVAAEKAKKAASKSSSSAKGDSGDDDADAHGSGNPAAAGMTMTAQAEGETVTITFTITFKANGGTGTPMSDQTVTKGASGTLSHNEYTRDGFAFTGWNTAPNGSGQGYADEEDTSGITDDLTLYAQWAEACAVTFNANGGAGEMADQLIPEGTTESLQENTFTHEGYTFEKWNTKADGSGKDYADGADFTAGAESITLYAQWKPVEAKTATIAFEANGGEGTMKSQEVTVGVETALNENAFKRNGYAFAGWNTKADGTGTAYADKGNISVTADITLYAQWNKELTVTFDKNGGSGEMANQTVISGVAATLNANAFTRDGHDFTGWNTQKDGKGTSYADKGSINVTADTTLYAQWTPHTFTVSFDSNGGSGKMDDQTFTYGQEEKLRENVFTRSGYTFSGWNTQKDGKGTSYSDKASISVTEDMTLYAQWKQDSSSSTKTSSSDKTTAKTGDATNVIPFVVLAVIAAGVIAFALIRRKRNEKD